MTTKNFYNTIRPMFPKGRMTAEHVNGVNTILGECRAARLSRQHAAYCLATAFHETGARMQPVREGFCKTDAGSVRAVTRLFEKKIIKRNYALRDPQTGKSYYGRGLVQITHKANYEKAGRLLGVDLVNDPDLALDTNVSAQILVLGMRDGWFTGVKLDDVSEPESSAPNFRNDRKVVNGRDRADMIARYAETFYAALNDVDLLSESRIIRAADRTKKTSASGVVAAVGTATASAVQAVTSDPAGAIDAAQQGISYAYYLPWAGAGVSLLLAALFIYQWYQGKQAEDARRDDYEANGM